MQKEAVKAVAKHPAPSHQEGEDFVYQVISIWLTWGTSERKELDGGTTVRKTALKERGENHNNYRG